MTTNHYEQFITLLRKTYPILSIENIIKNLEQAVETFGIEIYYSDMTHIKSPRKIDAYSYVNGNSPKIVVNGFLSEPKQRFVIAKQLGHILLHWKWLPNQELPENLVEISFHNQINNNVKENQAIQFAFEFLSPINHISNILKDIEKLNSDKNFQIASIADYYKISILQSAHQWKIIKKLKQ